MLSTQYTVEEVQSKLKDWEDYGLAADHEMEDLIKVALEENKFEFLQEMISDFYENGYIQEISDSASDRDDFLQTLYDTDQSYRDIFFAEVYFACSRFIKNLLESGFSEDEESLGGSFSVEGYSQSERSPELMADSNRKVKSKFYDKGRALMIRNEYPMTYRIQRG